MPCSARPALTHESCAAGAGCLRHILNFEYLDISYLYIFIYGAP